MKYNELMKELKSMGTAQNRKIYGRHGVSGAMFGISFANLGKLQKKIKIDHDLAVNLWASGNHDARVLATMIADPVAVKSADLDAWARDLDNYVLTDALAGLAGKTPVAASKMKKWTRSSGEWTGRAGWHLVAKLAMSAEDIPDEFFEAQLVTIEENIHQKKNRVRDAMNNALIAIGVRNPALEKLAIATARRIGKVEVDHGETSCKTNDAEAYIEKTKEYRKKKTKNKPVSW